MATKQHEALKLADWLDKCEPNFYGESSSRMDDSLSDAVCSLTGIARTQHALIVQMADCMKLLRNHTSVNSHQIALIDESLVPATQYLKGPKT